VDGSAVLLALASVALGATTATAYWRSRTHPEPATALRLTSTWRLAELGTPLLVARDVDVAVPAGSRVVVSGQVGADAFQAAQVRQVPVVTAEYAVDGERGRALLFLGGVHAGSQAMLVTDKQAVARLAAEATALWERAEPYVERQPLAAAASRAGLVVETQGTVLDVLPYQGAFLLRLEDAGSVLGVQVEREPAELKGQRILVRGKVGKDKGGYPVLVASDVRRLE
jgi:hypothetical protein